MSQEEIENYPGQIVYSIHRKKKVIYVWHTRMKELGFSERNGIAKGFTSLLEITRRKTTKNDNTWFLGWKRAKWSVYGDLKTLEADERNFCPDEADRIIQEIKAYLKLLNITLSKTIQIELL